MLLFRNTLPILVSFLFVGELRAQENHAKFSQLTVEDGLSQGNVYSVCQDYKGFIWMGTRDGLNKYDTREFTVYRNDPADSGTLSENYVVSLLEDNEKRLWVGTYKGLNLYNREKDRFLRIHLTDFMGNKPEVEPLISSIMEDSQGSVWFATSQGLYVTKKNNNTPKLVFHSSLFPTEQIRDNEIQAVYEDKEGVIWVGTGSGLIAATSSDHPIYGVELHIRYQFHKGNSNSFMNDDNIAAIYEVKDGELWVGTVNGGINILNKKNGKFSYIVHDESVPNGLASNQVRTIVKDRNGGYWIGTFNGLNHYSDDGKWSKFISDETDPHSLSHNSVRHIYQDRKGAIWIGTFFGGVNMLDRDIPWFTNYAHTPYVNSINHNVVSSIREDEKKNLWIGTDGGGLNYFDKEKNHFVHYVHDSSTPNSLSHNSIKALHFDREGNLWIGTYMGGISIMKGGTQTFEHIQHDPTREFSLSNNNVYAIEEDEKGNLWFGTYGGGLNLKVEKKENVFELYSTDKNPPYYISSNFVRSLFIDSKENLWVGTDEGLNVKWNGAAGFQVFKFSLDDRKSISGDIVLSIFEDSKGQIWLGTYSNGLNLYHPKTRSFTHFSEADGLPGNNIFGITEDDNNNLWLSTNNGICKFNPTTMAVKNYDVEDGIRGNEFVMGAYLRLDNGEMAFGGSHGLTVFHPDSLYLNSYMPPVVLTDLKLFNRSILPEANTVLAQHISETDEIVLRYNQNIFTVEFAALSYLHPNKNQYAYILKGFEEQWNHVKVPSATYTNLNAGDYTLLVKGANNDGVWNEIPTSLQIKVLPPPWKTWWAYVIYGFLVSGAVLLVINFTRIRAKLEHDLVIGHLEKERQKEIHEMKLNFFTNISHEFRTPLTLIMAPVEQVLTNSNVGTDVKAMLGTVKNNAARLLFLVNQLLDFRKQESNNMQLIASPQDLVALLIKVAHSFKYYAIEKRINLTFESCEESLQVYYDQDQIEKVVVNLISNAFKFTPEEGEIKIGLRKMEPDQRYSEGAVKITVEDNGPGIPKEELNNIFDCFYQINNKYRNNKRKENGSGIGLALVKRLVLSHGGEVAVDSVEKSRERKSHTCFRVVLPLGEGHLRKEQLAETYSGMQAMDVSRNKTLMKDLIMKTSPIENNYMPEKPEEDPVVKKSTHPILVVVEDNEEIRSLIVKSFQDKYRVFEASNGLEGWGIIRTQVPDVVISDIMMPQWDGIMLLDKIKKDISTNHIPVILLTARTSVDFMINGLETGSDDYITKPFHIEILKLKMSNILQSRERFRKKFIREYLLNPQEEIAVSPEKEFLKKVVNIVEQNIGEDKFTVNMLAMELGLSRPVLYRKLKQLTDLNVIELINQIRLKKSAQLLMKEGLSVSEVAYLVGFTDPKYFGKSFKAQFGKSPTDYIAAQEKLQMDDIC